MGKSSQAKGRAGAGYCTTVRRAFEKEAGFPIAEVSARLSYSPSGEFSSRVKRPGPSRNKVGCRRKDGYIDIMVCGRRILAHRLAWALHHGEWPNGEIDHINGNRSDNRICNLRCVPRSKNASNKRRYKNNISGFVGVTPEKTGWRARLRRDGVERYLGTFRTAREAHEARKAALAEYEGASQ